MVLGGSATATVTTKDELTDEAIDAKCQQLDAARAAKDYAAADAIRDELTAAGIEVQITKDGTTWRRKMI